MKLARKKSLALLLASLNLRCECNNFVFADQVTLFSPERNKWHKTTQTPTGNVVTNSGNRTLPANSTDRDTSSLPTVSQVQRKQQITFADKTILRRALHLQSTEDKVYGSLGNLDSMRREMPSNASLGQKKNRDLQKSNDFTVTNPYMLSLIFGQDNLPSCPPVFDASATFYAEGDQIEIGGESIENKLTTFVFFPCEDVVSSCSYYFMKQYFHRC